MSTPYVPAITDLTVDGFSLPFSNTMYDVDLAATTEKTLTVPGSHGLGASSTTKNRYLVIFKVESGATVWVANNATATVPTSSVATTDSEIIKNGMGRKVEEGDVLHFITSDTNAELSIVFYSIV